MRHIAVPPPITLYNIATGERLHRGGSGEKAKEPDAPWPMSRWLLQLVIPDPALGKGYVANRIRRAIHKASLNLTDNVMALEDEQYDRLRKAVEGPQGDVPGDMTMQLFEFEDAVINAYLTHEEAMKTAALLWEKGDTDRWRPGRE